jgi:hypothetical protein
MAAAAIAGKRCLVGGRCWRESSNRESERTRIPCFCLPIRNGLLAPRLLDEIFFRRGAPDVIHTDAAPEFMSELMAAILDATGTTRTTTCGHNAQSNGEIESWWRFWNRSMKFLSPSEYLVWPSFAQRICFAYYAVPHESLAFVSPFEMDFGGEC